MTVSISAALASAMADQVEAKVSAGTGPGTLKVYSGAKPASVATAATGTLLATFTLTDPAFAAAVAGVADLDADPDLSATTAAGTAGWFRIADSDGNAHLDGSVGTSGQDLNFTTVIWTDGGTANLTTGSVTHPLGA